MNEIDIEMNFDCILFGYFVFFQLFICCDQFRKDLVLVIFYVKFFFLEFFQNSSIFGLGSWRSVIFRVGFSLLVEKNFIIIVIVISF